MKTYDQLSKEERDKIAVRLAQGLSLRDIAKVLSRSHTTLSREIKRNSSHATYLPHRAQELARQRLKTTHSWPRKLQKDHQLRNKVHNMLKIKWSPEIISGILAKNQFRSISPETIYQWIYSKERTLIPLLLRHHPKRFPKHSHRLRHAIPGRVSIHERPPHINQRTLPGHWETDLLVGAGSSAIQVMVERLSRYTQLVKIPNRSPRTSWTALRDSLSHLPPSLLQSITYDNGIENSLHLLLNQALSLQSFFCDPYSSWQKGTVENTNGLIRRFLPKRTNFDNIHDKDILKIQNWLNSRPRKCLKFNTPDQTFKTLWCT